MAMFNNQRVHIYIIYAIYGNIYHQYSPNVSIYTSTMDPMGYKNIIKSPFTVVTAMMLADVPDSQKIVMAMNGRWGPHMARS